MADEKLKFLLKWSYCINRVYYESHKDYTINVCIINLLFGICSLVTFIILCYLIYVNIKKKINKGDGSMNDIRLHILVIVSIMSISLSI